MVHGNVPPADDGQALAARSILNQAARRLGAVARQKAHRDGRPCPVPRCDAGIGEETRSEPRRDGKGHAGAIAGEIVGGSCAPMGQGGQRLERHRHHSTGMSAVDVGDEPDSTGVVLVPRVVERRVDRLEFLAIHQGSPAAGFPSRYRAAPLTSAPGWLRCGVARDAIDRHRNATIGGWSPVDNPVTVVEMFPDHHVPHFTCMAMPWRPRRIEESA